MKLAQPKRTFKISMPVDYWLHQIAGIEPGPSFLEGIDVVLKRIRDEAYDDGYREGQKAQKEREKK